MIKPKRIFIVGHMGADKALLSEALAKKMSWKFIDANPTRLLIKVSHIKGQHTLLLLMTKI